MKLKKALCWLLMGCMIINFAPESVFATEIQNEKAVEQEEENSAEHSITVNGATASVSKAVEGTEVVLTKGIPEGKTFDKWETSEDVDISEDSFIMPGKDVTVTAVYKNVEKTEKEYTVTVAGGTADVKKAKAGTEIHLTANEADEGKTFERWEVMKGNVTVAENSFVMPAEEVEVKAVYKGNRTALSMPVMMTAPAGSNKITLTAEYVCNSENFSEATTENLQNVFDSTGEITSNSFFVLTFAFKTSQPTQIKKVEAEQWGGISEQKLFVYTGNGNPTADEYAAMKDALDDPLPEASPWMEISIDAATAANPVGEYFVYSYRCFETINLTAFNVSGNTVDERNVASIQFNGNGGTGSMPTCKWIKNSTYKLPACKYTAPENQFFSGWSVENGSQTTECKVGDSVTVSSDMTVKALWKSDVETSYTDAQGNSQTVPAKVFTDNLRELGTDQQTTWYVLQDDLTINDDVLLKGNVNLILQDGKSLKVNDAQVGASDYKKCSLTVYGQTEQTGSFSAKMLANVNGGYSEASVKTDSFTVNGGKVNITNYLNETTQPYSIFCNQLTVNKGELNCTQYMEGNFISAKNINVNGGTVNFQSKIRCGLNECKSLNITGGEFTATANNFGTTTSISGGKFHIEGEKLEIRENQNYVIKENPEITIPNNIVIGTNAVLNLKDSKVDLQLQDREITNNGKLVLQADKTVDYIKSLELSGETGIVQIGEVTYLNNGIEFDGEFGGIIGENGLDFSKSHPEKRTTYLFTPEESGGVSGSVVFIPAGGEADARLILKNIQGKSDNSQRLNLQSLDKIVIEAVGKNEIKLIEGINITLTGTGSLDTDQLECSQKLTVDNGFSLAVECFLYCRKGVAGKGTINLLNGCEFFTNSNENIEPEIVEEDDVSHYLLDKDNITADAIILPDCLKADNLVYKRESYATISEVKFGEEKDGIYWQYSRNYGINDDTSGLWDVWVLLDGKPKTSNVDGTEADNVTNCLKFDAAGEYTIQFRNETNTKTVKKCFTIRKKKSGITWDDKSDFVYNGASQIPTASASGLIAGDSCAVKTEGEGTKVGEYTARAVSFDNPNYELADNIPTKPFKINALPLEIKNVILKDRTYEKGNKSVEVESVEFVQTLQEGDLPSIGKGLTVTAELTGEKADSAGNGKNALVTVNLTDSNFKLVKSTCNGTANITKAALNKEMFKVSDNVYTYDGKEHCPTVTVNPQYAGVGSITVETKGTDVSKTEVQISVGEGENYEDGKFTLDSYLEIQKADAEVTLPEKETLKYDGSEQNLLTAGNSNEGEFYYSLSNSANDEDWKTAVPKKTDAGQYTVWYRFKADKNHKDIAPTQITDIEIEKADYDMANISFNDGTAVYDGKPHSLEVTGTLPTGLDSKQLTVSYTGSVTDVKEGAVEIRADFATESVNYNVPASMTAKISLTKAIPTAEMFTTDNLTLQYNGKEQHPTVTARETVKGTGAVTVLTKGTEVQSNIGNSKIVFNVAEGDNYEKADNLSLDGEFNITKHAALDLTDTVYLVKNTKDYTKTMYLRSVPGFPANETPVYELGGNLDNIGNNTKVVYNPDGSLTMTADDSKESEDITISVNVKNMKNYEDSRITLTLKYVDKTIVDISNLEVAGKIYDGTAVAYKGSPIAKKKTDSAEVTPEAGYQYTWLGTDGTVYPEAPADAGKYRLLVEVKDEDPNYIGSASIPFEITKAAVIITADNKTAHIGGEQPAYTYKISGLYGNDRIKDTVQFTDNSENMKTAGTYEIMPSGADGGNNYEIQYVCGVLTVEDHIWSDCWFNDDTNHWHECTVCKAHKDEEKHSWKEPDFEFSEDGKSAVAKTSCICGKKLVKNAEITSEITTPSTCTVMGITTYTAKITIDGKEYSSCTTRQDVELQPHSYDKNTWKNDATYHWHECTECHKVLDRGTHTYGDWEIVKRPTVEETGEKRHFCTICNYEESVVIPKKEILPEPVVPETPGKGGKKFRLESEEGISEVPSAVAEKNPNLNSPAKIEKEMKVVITNRNKNIPESQTRVMDVELMVLDAGTNTWKPVEKDDFPKKGLVITIPYPEGTGKDSHDFVVAHMFTDGDKAGTVEYPALTKTEKGLQFTLTGFSPISIGWKETSEPTVSPNDSNNSADHSESSSDDSGSSAETFTFDWPSVCTALVKLADGGSYEKNVLNENRVPGYIWKAVKGRNITVTFIRGNDRFVFNGLDLQNSGFDETKDHNLTELRNYIGRTYEGAPAEKKEKKSAVPKVDSKRETDTEEIETVEETVVEEVEEITEDSEEIPDEAEAVSTEKGNTAWIWILAAAAVLVILAGSVFFVWNRKNNKK